MLTYFRFLLLPRTEKIQYIRNEGNLILERYTGTGKVHLFSINDFFVEISHEKESDEVTDIVVFKGTNRLQHYTGNVSLSELTSSNAQLQAERKK